MADELLKPSPCFPSLKAWCDYCEGAAASLNNIRRAFTLLARTAFANITDSGSYADPLGCRSYSDDPSKSSISIQPASVIDPGDTQNIPGILVSVPGGLAYQRPMLNPNKWLSPDYSITGNVAFGKAKVQFLCRDRDADIACLMSDLLMTVMLAARGPVLKMWHQWLLDYDLSTQTEPELKTNPDDATQRWYESSAVIELTLAVGATAHMESKRLTGASVYALGPDGDPGTYVPCPQ